MSTNLDLVSTDLTTRLRLAIAHNVAWELEVLNPIIRGLAQGLVQLSEIEALDAEVAQRLVFAWGKARAGRRRPRVMPRIT